MKWVVRLDNATVQRSNKPENNSGEGKASRNYEVLCLAKHVIKLSLVGLARTENMERAGLGGHATEMKILVLNA